MKTTKQAAIIAATALTFAAVTMTHVATLHIKLDRMLAELDAIRETVTEPADGAGRADVLADLLAELAEPEPEPPAEEATEIEPELQSLGTFKLTAYCPCAKCCGEWADGITYTGTEATAGRTVAVDPKVIPLGSTVYINGSAYVAEDIGGAIKGNRIDVYFSDHQTALQFGVQHAEVEIQK